MKITTKIFIYKLSKKFCRSPEKRGETIQNINKIKNNNKGIIQIRLSEPITIGNEINKPPKALLEVVKKVARPIDIKKLYAMVFLKKTWFFSNTNAKQNGQIKLSQHPA